MFPNLAKFSSIWTREFPGTFWMIIQPLCKVHFLIHSADLCWRFKPMFLPLGWINIREDRSNDHRRGKWNMYFLYWDSKLCPSSHYLHLYANSSLSWFCRSSRNDRCLHKSCKVVYTTWAKCHFQWSIQNLSSRYTHAVIYRWNLSRLFRYFRYLRCYFLIFQ